MDTSRPSFWQLTALSALMPIVGFWPALFVLPNEPARASEINHDARIQEPTQIFPLPQIAEYQVKRTLTLTVTAYSSTRDQTDADPFITASGTLVRDGIIAHNFLPFGTRVRFPDVFGDKVFVVQDRMHPRKGYYIADIWMPTREEAKTWGAPSLTMEILGS